MKVAVIGAGVAGITAALMLDKKHDVTLLEKNSYLGGHTNTREVAESPEKTLAVDTGFIVCNERNYPTFYKMLASLGVELRDSDMSFGYYCEESDFGYTGPRLSEALRKPSNFLKSRFLGMLLEQRRFNRVMRKALEEGQLQEVGMQDFISKHDFSQQFIEDYFLPLSAAIWSSSEDEMLKFPALTFATFFRNHGMLNFSQIPNWQTVVGGSYAYIKEFKSRFSGAWITDSPVSSVRRSKSGVSIHLGNHIEEFDQVILASHADEALSLLQDSSEEERALLGEFRYHSNDVVLHTDRSIMPKDKSYWASWNYFRRAQSAADQPVAITYHMNRLQGLESSIDYLVTLNQTELVDPSQIIYQTNYTHPAYTPACIEAQDGIKELNGERRTFFCGSYMGYGFHEDAVKSAAEVAEQLGGTF